ncbi:hypothetical protein Psed_3471 [Pseudonocardia dioxanivorans CB1190]|uniref:Uncharacterized protein n=1 Tax=Pseudonocardia dioxanivorans (strain ATCC 55486 / DSM 44775 / JCM 13855 / CB1190) TaxID=675635 RepID=F4CZC2_PSEUX|nr:hypothetical protein [Pseudonocardia dioxanivorans]AEA25653.1 hypothetical protein Psed_3471 [Pseudonocardia dioxanivorans CB1190]
MGAEDPPEDVAEQRLPVVTDRDDDEFAVGRPTEPPLEADPADVAEQQLTVPVDEPDPT